MSLSARFQTSWQLLQSSVQVLRSNPRLLLFPLVNLICAIALILVFFVPVFALWASFGWQGHDWEREAAQIRGVFYVYGAFIYLITMVAATFFNVAFYDQIMRAFAGENVSLGAGLRFAATRWKAILMWSLLAATVGLIIRHIEEKLGFIGRIIMGLVGSAWSVAAVFAIPVIIRRQDANPLAVLRDSALTLKRTWGESLIGFMGIQLGAVVLVLLTFAFGLTTLLGAFAVKHFWFLGWTIGLWIVLVIVWSYFLSMATHVYRCALYVYASEGVVPGPFTAEMMNSAWKVKKA